MLTLAEAVKSGRLQEFIDQEEARGVGPIDRAEFDAAVKRAAKAGSAEDRTSHSRARGGSTER